ncbi:MAG TPA: hypothetical protein VH370_03410 [Humisphaera sp.]|jgi:hypothetical protein|nr:hypothetical protein [Humisphaera sp.]
MKTIRQVEASDLAIAAESCCVRALRWDVSPRMLVFDCDYALNYRTVSKPATIDVCRTWIVFAEVADLRVQIDWKAFVDGFSIIEFEVQKNGTRSTISIATEFPSGEIFATARSIGMLRSESQVQSASPYLEYTQRLSLASDTELALALQEQMAEGRMGETAA